MPKCPRCGSTAQVRELDTEYFENGANEILVIRHYRCGCGCEFTIPLNGIVMLSVKQIASLLTFPRF